MFLMVLELPSYYIPLWRTVVKDRCEGPLWRIEGTLEMFLDLELAQTTILDIWSCQSEDINSTFVLHFQIAILQGVQCYATALPN